MGTYFYIMWVKIDLGDAFLRIFKNLVDETIMRYN